MDPISLRVFMGAAGATDAPWGPVVLRPNAPSFGNLFAVTWTGTNFVAVGDSFFTARSADNVFWTSGVVGSGTDVSLRGVTHGAGITTAVGTRGAAFTSADNGASWTTQSTGLATTITLNAVATSGSEIVAVGTSGTIIYSFDGVTWFSASVSVTTNIQGITWGGGQYVAVGVSGTVLTSPDGVNWTQQTGVGSSNLLTAVHGNGLFVAAGTNLPGGSLPIIYTSPDGITWTQQTPAASVARVVSLVWNGSIFLAGHLNGVFSYSSDGASWTLVSPVPSGGNAITGLAWSGTSFSAVLLGSTLLGSSTGTTGSSWTSRNNATPLLNMRCILWTGTEFFATADESPSTSPDGLNWTTASSTKILGAPTRMVRGIIRVGTRTVAVGDDGAISARDTDNSIWFVKVNGGSQQLYGVAFSGSLYVVVGGDTSGFIRTSPDGNLQSWTTRTSNSTTPLYGVTWANNLFVAVGGSGSIVTSANGTSWTLRVAATGQTLYAIAFGSGRFVAVGAAGTVRTSTDGISWGSFRLPDTIGVTLRDIVRDNGQFIVCADNGRIYTSPTGLSGSWVLRLGETGNVSSLLAVAAGGPRTVAVGAKGSCSMSPRPATPPYPTI